MGAAPCDWNMLRLDRKSSVLVHAFKAILYDLEASRLLLFTWCHAYISSNNDSITKDNVMSLQCPSHRKKHHCTHISNHTALLAALSVNEELHLS